MLLPPFSGKAYFWQVPRAIGRPHPARPRPLIMDDWHALAPSVAVVLKTGASVMAERLPNMLSDYLRHVPNLLVVSDAPAIRLSRHALR